MGEDLQSSSNAQEKLRTKKNRDPENIILSTSKSFMHAHTNLVELSTGKKFYSFVVEWQLPDEDEKIYTRINGDFKV